MRKHLKEFTYIELLAIAIVLAEVLLLIYYNLTCDFSFDQDAAKVMYHTIKMWQQKSFIIPNWSYMTTGEWDCVSFLAMPIYGLTNNIFLAFSISNIINIVIYVFVIYILLSSVNVRLTNICVAISIVLIPYSWGMLGYTNLMFYSAGQYAYKVLTPLCMLATLHYFDKYKNKIVYYFLLVLTLLLIFLTTTSSGLYVPGCGLLAIYIVRFVYYLLNKFKIKKSELIVLISCLLVIGVSYYLHTKWGVYSVSDNIEHGNPLGHIKAYIESLIGVFGIELSNSLFSWHTVIFLLKILVFVFVFGFGLISINKTFYISKILNKSNTETYQIESELISIFILNSIVTIMTWPTSRYELIGTVPLILLSTINFNRLKVSNKVNYLLFACLIALNGLQQYSSYIYINRVYRYNFDKDVCMEILNTAYENNANMIVIYDYTEWSEVLRLYDLNMEVRTYNTIMNEFEDHDVTDGKKSSDYIEDKNCLILTDFNYDIDNFSEYIKNNYTYKFSTNKFVVYAKR